MTRREGDRGADIEGMRKSMTERRDGVAQVREDDGGQRKGKGEEEEEEEEKRLTL